MTKRGGNGEGESCILAVGEQSVMPAAVYAEAKRSCSARLLGKIERCLLAVFLRSAKPSERECLSLSRRKGRTRPASSQREDGLQGKQIRGRPSLKEGRRAFPPLFSLRLPWPAPANGTDGRKDGTGGRARALPLRQPVHLFLSARRPGPGERAASERRRAPGCGRHCRVSERVCSRAGPRRQRTTSSVDLLPMKSGPKTSHQVRAGLRLSLSRRVGRNAFFESLNNQASTLLSKDFFECRDKEKRKDK